MLGAVVDMKASSNGEFLALVSDSDKYLKIFDVVNLDMITMIPLNFTPQSNCSLCWAYMPPSKPLIAVTNETTITIYDIFSGSIVTTVASGIHMYAINSLNFVSFSSARSKYSFFISSDVKGMIEYWQFDPENPTSSENGKYLENCPFLQFKLKLDTDLYAFAGKSKPQLLSLTIGNDAFDHFFTISSDGKLRVFDTFSGKVKLTLTILDEGDQKTFQALGSLLPLMNVVLDDTGRFLFVSTLTHGIDVYDLLLTGKDEASPCLSLGTAEDMKDFCPLRLAFLTPMASKKTKMNVENLTSDNPAFKDLEVFPQQLLLCTASGRSRVFVFSRYEPTFNEATKIFERDVMNERLVDAPADEKKNATAKPQNKDPPKNEVIHVIIHTDYGDIGLELYPRLAPKAVENFVTHSKNHYYDGTTFHRVIKGFMIQGGDPLGDGTGGESIWGRDFEDEILDKNHPILCMSKPFLLCMANIGTPCSNGSQFFITVGPTPWLQGKHTIFGKAVKGLDVIKRIEVCQTDVKFDRPVAPIKIIDIELLEET